MAKQMFTLRDFSGGINTTKDPRDISLNEQVYLKDFYVDQNGALRPSGSLISHDGLVNNKDLPAGNIISVIQNSAGYNLAYFETDHDIAKGSLTGQDIDFFDGGQERHSGGPTQSMADDTTYPE